MFENSRTFVRCINEEQVCQAVEAAVTPMKVAFPHLPRLEVMFGREFESVAQQLLQRHVRVHLGAILPGRRTGGTR